MTRTGAHRVAVLGCEDWDKNLVATSTRRGALAATAHVYTGAINPRSASTWRIRASHAA